jgi:hypothetical protein
MSEIKNLGGTGMGPQRTTKIVGAKPIDQNSQPEIRDSRTPVEPTQMDVRVHEETITEGDKLRRPKRDPSEPDVRIRNAPTADEFDVVKRGDDE